MTRLQNALISQILIGVAFAIGAFFLFLIMDALIISDIFSDFYRNGYQGQLTVREVAILFMFYHLPIIGIVAAFGIFEHNIFVNLLGILWAVPSFGWLARNFTLFQPYFFTTWEGRLFLVDIGARVLVLLIAIVGIVVTCRSWHRWYKHKNKCGNRG